MSGYIVRGTGKRSGRTLWSAEDEVCYQALPVRDLASEYDSLESASAAAERMRGCTDVQIIPVDVDIISVGHVVALTRLFIDIHRNAWTMRRYPERTRPYLCDAPLSGLFPGPVIDGGRRLWDHNPNCRERARMRYYAGFEGDELRARFGAAERGGR